MLLVQHLPIFDGGALTLTCPLTPNTITLVSSTSILNASTPVLLTATDMILFNAQSGDVGSAISPINTSAPGGIFRVGVTTVAWIEGMTGDRTVHCLPNNPPVAL